MYSKKKINDGEIHIYPNFTKDKTEFNFDCEPNFRLYRAVYTGILIILYFYKIGRRKNND